MSYVEKIRNRELQISVIGLGYVGMPIAVAFSKVADVIGFDISEEKVDLYKRGIDPTNEVGNDAIRNSTVKFTSDENELKKSVFHIVSVPTPVNPDHSPDLRSIESASQIVGRNLVKGAIVVFESTVYPGVTEEVCIPILEKVSGMKCGTEFKVGYSPERINPGDKVHRLESIIKVVSGMDHESLEIIASVYELVVVAGVYRAQSIKVAEAAKVIENSQRDINIAFMNELSIIFNKMGIDTSEVLKAAGTKWNFLHFYPGLVGGHCIGVDPYYLTYKAEQLGYHSQIVLAGRRINDDMGKYVVESLIKKLIKANVSVKSAKIAILGFTFKENCPDTRNTRVIDIVNELNEYGLVPKIYDPKANNKEVVQEYGLALSQISDIENVNAIIIAVAHREFLNLGQTDFNMMFGKTANESRVIMDVKGILDRTKYEELGYHYWRL